MKMASEDVFEGTRFLPFATKLHRNSCLRAVRHTFFTLMPFLLAVYVLDIAASLVMDPWGPLIGETGMNLGFWLTGGLSGDEYRQHDFVQAMAVCRRITGIGYGLISMAIAMVLAKELAQLWDADKEMTAFCALAAFLFLLPQPEGGHGDFVDYFAGRRFLPAFLTAFLSARLFSWISHAEGLRVELPRFLPGKLVKYFASVLPVSLTLLLLAILSLVFGVLWGTAVPWLRSAVSMEFFQHPLVAMLYQFVVWTLWWFGMPGYGFTSPVQQLAYLPAQASNQLGDAGFVFTSGFFEAGLMHVLGFVIAILVFSGHESWRAVAKLSLPAMLFNIQEPVMFCLPVVLNPFFFLPYLLAPMANTFLGWIAISWGIVPVFKFGLPWTMPVLLNGSFGTGSFMGGALQAVWLVMDIFIYAPFVITANMLEFKGEAKEDGRR